MAENTEVKWLNGVMRRTTQDELYVDGGVYTSKHKTVEEHQVRFKFKSKCKGFINRPDPKDLEGLTLLSEDKNGYFESLEDVCVASRDALMKQPTKPTKWKLKAEWVHDADGKILRISDGFAIKIRKTYSYYLLLGDVQDRENHLQVNIVAALEARGCKIFDTADEAVGYVDGIIDSVLNPPIDQLKEIAEATVDSNTKTK